MTINPEVFEEAARRIERTGMTKGVYYRGDQDDLFYPDEVGEHIRENESKCCIMGALAAEGTYLDQPDSPVRISDYSEFLAKTLGLDGVHSLIDWNDKPHRRKGDLVHAFRRAAAKAREEQ